MQLLLNRRRVFIACHQSHLTTFLQCRKLGLFTLSLFCTEAIIGIYWPGSLITANPRFQRPRSERGRVSSWQSLLGRLAEAQGEVEGVRLWNRPRGLAPPLAGHHRPARPLPTQPETPKTRQQQKTKKLNLFKSLNYFVLVSNVTFIAINKVYFDLQEIWVRFFL